MSWSFLAVASLAFVGLVYTEAPGHQWSSGVAARPRPGRKESKKEGARERERERVSTVLGRWKLNCEKVAVESL